ncbi:MAG: phosphate ABC transporter permease PstA [Synechococcales bacterium]|nr:phosphate ABC transporter permease PstA [Synechococcales bacterium]
MTSSLEAPQETANPSEAAVRRLKKNPGSASALFNTAMTGVAGLCAMLAIAPLIAILFYVLFQGWQRLDLPLLTQLPPPPLVEGGGLGNAIIGTLLVVGIATGMAVPFGILAAVYLAEFSGDRPKIARNIRFATNVLSGVPSIIAGVFAYGLLVATGALGYSAIAGGMALAVLMLPTIVRTTDEALQLVPQDLRWAAASVGASSHQTLLKIVLPAAVPSILTGVVLAVARAAGETAPLIFTALNSSFWPRSLLEPIATLAVNVYNFALVPYANQQQLAWAGALILVILVLATSVISRSVTRRRISEQQGG